MVETNIFRSLTEKEKTDMKIREIGTRDFRDKFSKELAKVQEEYARKYKPICIRCARVDFNDAVERLFKEMGRRQEISPDDERLTKIFPFDYDLYGKESRFEVVGEDEVRISKTVDGVRVPYVSGYNINYRCRERGCGYTIFVPKPVYDEMKKKKPVEEEEEKVE